MIRTISLIILLISLPLCTKAGAWNKDKGHGYAQIGYTYLSYTQLLKGGATKTDLKRRVLDQTLQYYEEYGISNRFNILISIPYKFVSTGSSLIFAENDPYINDTLQSGSLNGFSNLGIAGKFNILNKKYVLSAQIKIENEMSQYQQESGLRIGYEAWLFTPTILIGRGWNKTFMQAELGAQLNTNNYAQNVVGNFEFGYKFKNEKSILMFRIDAKVPFTQGHFNEGNSVQTGLYRDNSSYISPGLKLSQKFMKQWYLNLAGYGAFFSENEGSAATWNAGIAYEW